MYMKANLSNSIYQQRKAGPGLTTECGMLINNRPDSVTGIQQAVQIKKAMRKSEKVVMMAESVAMGNQMGGSSNCMG
jgi:hypothetical protein